MLTTNCVNYTKNTASASAMKRILAESFALKEANEAHIMAARKLLAYCKDVQHMTTKLRSHPRISTSSHMLTMHMRPSRFPITYLFTAMAAV